MESIPLLFLGLLLGLHHSLEADHLAAVASLATRSRGIRSTVVQGVAWGFGHTLTLLAVGGVCLVLRATIPERVAQGLEAAAGVMLLYLGADVLLRWRRRRIHVHLHRHDDGTVHLHAHSHAGEEHPAQAANPAHAAHPHEHPHAKGLPLRAMLVGLVHGLAGSAALLLLTLSTLTSVWLGLVYIAVFGIGSILGMAVPLGDPRLAAQASGTRSCGLAQRPRSRHRRDHPADRRLGVLPAGALVPRAARLMLTGDPLPRIC